MAAKFEIWAEYLDSDGIKRRALVYVRDRMSWSRKHANRIARDFTFRHNAVTLVKEA